MKTNNQPLTVSSASMQSYLSHVKDGLVLIQAYRNTTNKPNKRLVLDPYLMMYKIYRQMPGSEWVELHFTTSLSRALKTYSNLKMSLDKELDT